MRCAVNCASIGGPDLPARAVAAANLEATLAAGARGFVGHPRGCRIGGGRSRVSSICGWFKADFGGTDAGVFAQMRDHAAPDPARTLENIARISGRDRDWAINRAPA